MRHHHLAQASEDLAHDNLGLTETWRLPSLCRRVCTKSQFSNSTEGARVCGGSLQLGLAESKERRCATRWRYARTS